MNQFHPTSVFDSWLSSLEDKIGTARIASRIRAAEAVNFADCEAVGEEIFSINCFLVVINRLSHATSNKQ